MSESNSTAEKARRFMVNHIRERHKEVFRSDADQQHRSPYTPYQMINGVPVQVPYNPALDPLHQHGAPTDHLKYETAAKSAEDARARMIERRFGPQLPGGQEQLVRKDSIRHG